MCYVLPILCYLSSYSSATASACITYLSTTRGRYVPGIHHHHHHSCHHCHLCILRTRVFPESPQLQADWGQSAFKVPLRCKEQKFLVVVSHHIPSSLIIIQWVLVHPDLILSQSNATWHYSSISGYPHVQGLPGCVISICVCSNWFLLVWLSFHSISWHVQTISQCSTWFSFIHEGAMCFFFHLDILGYH